MATSTSTWLTGSSALWSDPVQWSPTGTPNDANTAVLIDAAPVGAIPYTVTIATGTAFSVAALTLNNASATLLISGTLQANGGDLLINQGSVTLGSNASVLNGVGTLTGRIAGRGSIPGTGTLTNLGTIIADRTLNTLTISAPMLNSGTVMSAASGGGSVLLISGSALGNYAAGTLTGGSFMAVGSATSENAIRFHVAAASTPITTNAARLVLDGRSSDIEVRNGTSFDSIGTQLQSIAAAGVLDVRNHKAFAASNTLTNAGTLILQNGTLSGPLFANASTLTGYGSVAGTIANTGTILVSGGALDVDETITGSGFLNVGTGARLILEGASPTALHNDGTVYNTEGVLNLGTITGSGTIVVENGATVTIGDATSQTIMFGGADATLRLDDLPSFAGTLVGFGGGDTLFGADRLVLGGVTATAASIVNGNTLAIINGGSTIDTITLSGDYTGATFATTQQGGDSVVRVTAGAPARNGLSATISVTDLAAINDTTEGQIVSNLEAAIADWGRYITGHAPLRISLTLSNTTEGSRLAEALYTSTILTGETIGGKAIVMPSSIYALTTGNYITGTSIDVAVTLFLGGSNLTNLFIDPDPYDSGSVPALQFDLTTVFRHEMAHGLGMYGLTVPTTGVLGSQATLYDINMTTVLNAGTVTSATFNGANAMATYGSILGAGTATAVPLTSNAAEQNLYHFANSTLEPLATDLMNGIGIGTGTSIPISAMDLAVLRDLGVPVTAGIVCYARGTGIATPSGETPIEALCVGDAVLVREGEGTRIERIRWVGHRRIDLTRHSEPWRAEPIRIRRDALAPGVPKRDLLVSPPHGILLGDALVPAELLVNHRSILRESGARSVDYFHIELDHHAILLAEGLAAESYLDTGNRAFFANGGPVIEAHPSLTLPAAWPEAACVPLLVTPEAVGPLWQALADRAERLFPDAPAAMTDPDLHLLIGGRRLDPIARAESRHSFLLPPGTTAARLLSRHAIPAEATALSGDRRRLGVSIRRLVFRDGDRLWDIPADHPGLRDGWHTAETDAGGVWRWTAGDAAIPVPPADAPLLLEIHLGPATAYPVPVSALAA